MKILISTFVTVLLIAASAIAAPRDGAQEILVAGGYNRQIGTGTGTFNADLSYGYFIDKAVEVGVRQQFNYTLVSGPGDVWFATTAPFIDYHFAGMGPNQTVVPFVGGLVGGVWNEEDLTGTIGPEGGVKVYLDQDTFLLGRYHYQWFFDELKEVNDTLESAHVVTVGLGWNW